MIKLFPGNILGPGFLSAIKELFPNLLFMPTGGVDLDKENIAGWFKAAASLLSTYSLVTVAFEAGIGLSFLHHLLHTVCRYTFHQIRNLFYP